MLLTRWCINSEVSREMRRFKPYSKHCATTPVKEVLRQHLHLVQAFQQQILKDADKVRMGISDILKESVLELERLRNSHAELRMTSTPKKEFMNIYTSPSYSTSDIQTSLTFDKLDESGICEEKQCSAPSTEEQEELSSNQHRNDTTLPYVENVIQIKDDDSEAKEYLTLASNKDYVQNNPFSVQHDFSMTQDAQSDLTIEELNSTEIEEGSLTGESSSHIFGRQVVTSSITSNPEQHKDVVMKHKGDFVDHNNHSYIQCSGSQDCPHKATIDPGSPCSCDGIRLYPDDVFTDTVEGRQQLGHIQKLQNRKGNLEENFKKMEVNEMTETNLVDDVFNVLELERSVCKLEDTKIQLFRQENALLKKKLSQLQFDTQCLTEQNASFKGTINKLMEEKNIAELCLAQAEQDRELFVKEMNMITEKCEELVREKKHILSEKNHLTIEKQFMSKEISKLKIGNWRMEEELAIITREKDKIANLVKSTHQDLLTHTEEKLQLQLKLRDALTENNQLKMQLTESKVQSSEPNESCLHLMKFHGNKTNPESDVERGVITPLGSSSERYEPFFHDQLLHEIKNLTAKNLMLWTSFCEYGQKCQFLSKLVHDLKNDNDMMNVDLEERAKTNAVLESKIKNLIEEKFSCEMWITKLENHKEMLKLKLYDLQGNLLRYREHISDDQIYKELLTRHHQEEGYHTYCELCQGIYNHQHKAKLLAVEANRNIAAIQRLLTEECFQRDSTYKNPVSVLIPVNFTSSITAARRRSSHERADARQEQTDAASLVSEHSFTNISHFTVE